MRKAFIDSLIDSCRKNRNIFLLTADMGFSVFEGFQKQFPDRFYNMGVAEANMIGVAAGLALSGKKVIVYSIVPFVTMRCFEQVRNDICLQDLDVKIIGSGGGLCYGSAGPTHHSIEDIAIMRSLPNMVVLCPGDPLETKLCLRAAIENEGPVYIRLGKGKDEWVHESLGRFSLGKAITLSGGSDMAIIVTGNMLPVAKKARDIIASHNISARLISMPCVKPLDKDAIIKASKETKFIFTIEEHSLLGGLGSAVAEVLAENRSKAYFKRFALPDKYLKFVGSQEYLRGKLGLDDKSIARDILKIYKKEK